ncbi:hypothetical protein [Arenimonas sp.]|uniref:hypothetical protein n=1 Tax=Arenimonas sp. TaxID=1872635 RepID=UPI0025C6D276|nr:hypothetical protein [Arenimonas sp.]
MPEVTEVTLSAIEKQTRTFAEHQRDLRFLVEALQAEVEDAKRRAMKKIRNAVERATNSRAELKALIEQRPDLFVRPRSVVIDGIKVGFQKAKGGLVIDDEQRTCALIHKHLPDVVDQLIVSTEKPVKAALNLLTAADLKRIGVKVTDDTDEVLIKDTASDVDKLVAALLKEEADT